MKKAFLFFVALSIVLGLAASGCYYERECDHPWYHHRYHHDDDHYRDYGHRGYGRGDDDDD